MYLERENHVTHIYYICMSVNLWKYLNIDNYIFLNHTWQF